MKRISELWQEDKRFILQVGGALALFLILNSCAIEGLHSAALSQRDRNQREQRNVEELQRKVFARYGEEEKATNDLQAIEAELRKRFLTAAPTRVPDARKSAPQIQFSEGIDGLWSELQGKANQKNVKLPEKITTVELGVPAQGGAQEDLVRCASYLETLSRAMRVCVDEGMVELGKPQIHNEEQAEITNAESTLVIYQRITLPVQGPFESFGRVLREFQKPGSFVQARLLSLDAKGTRGVSALRGQLEFVGLHFEEQSEDVEPKPETKVRKAAKPKSRKQRRSPPMSPPTPEKK